MGREMLLNAQHVPQPGLLSHTHTHIHTNSAQGTITTTNEGEGKVEVEQWKLDRKLAGYSVGSLLLEQIKVTSNDYHHYQLFFSIMLHQQYPVFSNSLAT